MKAVIPAAGFGTRFLPATKAQPKEMLPLVDKPTIQYVVEEAVDSGIDDILIITGRGKRAIEDHFDKHYELENFLKGEEKHQYLEEIDKVTNLADIHYVRQKHAEGLGKAIYCAKKYVGKQAFVVLLGDTVTFTKIPCTKQLLDLFQNFKSSIIAVEKVPVEKVERYGIIKGHRLEEGIFEVEDLVEKPHPEDAPSNLAIFGRYVLTPEIFSCIERTTPGKNGEIQLTDAIKLLLQKEKVYAFEITGTRYDLGSKIDWLKANIEMALQREELNEDLTAYLKKNNLIKPSKPRAAI